MSNDGHRDPAIAAALKAASKTIPVTQGERLRIEMVVDGHGEIMLSLPPSHQEGDFWKAYVHLMDFAKVHYAGKRSPMAL